MGRQKLRVNAEREREINRAMASIKESKRKLNRMIEDYKKMPRIFQLYNYIVEHNLNNFDVKIKDEVDLYE